MSDGQVVDNADEHRFELLIDGHRAELVYERNADRLVLVHTEVPEELGGRGIGGRLRARRRSTRPNAASLVVVPHCPFAGLGSSAIPTTPARVTIDWARPRP